MIQHTKILATTALTFIVTTCWFACDEGDSNNGDDFDRTAMLQNMANNIIIPAYAELSDKATLLQSAAEAFTQTPSLPSLNAVQLAWEETYLAWQYANAFNFGPAGEEGLRKRLIEELGTFPVSESKINTILSSGAYNLSDFNRDARGLLVIEFLLFNLNDDHQAIVESFSSAIRKQYLNDLIANTNTRLIEVTTAWNGDYRSEFINNNGTDVGSSTSQLYNEFVRSFEAVKNFKVALPLGKEPGQTQTEPALVEAYYSGKSVQFFKAHVRAIEDIWYGKKKDGTDGIGFEEYLQNVTGGEELITSTKAQLQLVNAAMNAIPATPRFSTQLNVTPLPIDAFLIELQKNTRYFKSDMSSLLGIAITFSSSDGD
jgi:uncharacterized protein